MLHVTIKTEYKGVWMQDICTSFFVALWRAVCSDGEYPLYTVNIDIFPVFV